MTLNEARLQVLSAFEDDTCYYSHVLPLKYADFIDGMAWVGLLCGASYLVGDTVLAQKSEDYLKRLLAVGDDARNFAPVQVSSDWIKSKTINGFWYYKKPQSFAGPVGLRFAIDCGAHLNDPFKVKSTARLITRFGSIAGYILGHDIPWVSDWLKQHVNSIFLAYLVLKEKPVDNLLWLCQDNPFYSYIAGIKCNTEYPDPSKVSNGTIVEEDVIVPLKYRKPSSWIFRNWPKSRYVRDGEAIQTYTPVWQVVGEYLQSTL